MYPHLLTITLFHGDWLAEFRPAPRGRPAAGPRRQERFSSVDKRASRPMKAWHRVLRLMLAASMLVLLAQIYLSSSLRASSPAAVPPSQSANVMPRVTLEGGSLCHAAPWSLAHLRAQCQTGPLRYFYAYAALQSSWNAFQHIRRCHRHCTYICPCRLMRARATHTRASHAYTRVPCIHARSMHTLHAHPMRPNPCYTATWPPPGTW